jgi:hypothetical protein
MKKRQIIQPILWIEQPTGAVMGAGSLWLLRKAHDKTMQGVRHDINII